jgi:hypothetical protein
MAKSEKLTTQKAKDRKNLPPWKWSDRKARQMRNRPSQICSAAGVLLAALTEATILAKDLRPRKKSSTD